MTNGINWNGRVLWEGHSPIDGAPIVCIVTGLTEGSGNIKTGRMLQVWILRADCPPHHAFKDGRGRSVCGDCPHAGYNNGTCYVRWYQAPLSVWNCYKRGGYLPIGYSWPLFDGATVRFGSAGDPAMVPADIWANILSHCAKHTAYTHQWRQPWAQHLRGIAQASCDGFVDYVEASSHGWKTFLVKPAHVEAPAGSVHCQASVEMGAKTTCALCTLCDGDRRHVVINAHGAKASKVAFAA
jgi:hypothetical protein